MFRLAQQKMFIVFSFPVNYGIKVISLCGDNSTEYDYEGFTLENLVFMEKLENLFSNFLLLFKYPSINSYMVFTW